MGFKYKVLYMRAEVMTDVDKIDLQKRCRQNKLLTKTRSSPKLTKFSLTIPSLAAKKASTCEIKCFSSFFSCSQCCMSFDKSTSSAVQNEASAFLYIFQMSWYWMGNTTNLFGLSLRSGSTSVFVFGAGFTNGFISTLSFCMMFWNERHSD